MKGPIYLINDSYSCFVEHCWIRIEEEDIDLNVLQLFDVLYWLMATLLLVFGLPLNLSIIHYERFGGDSQKRSLGNRFSSYAVAFSMAASFSLLSFVGLTRYNIGPTEFQAFFFKMFLGSSYAMFWYLQAIMFLRILQVVVWKRVMEINEDLVSSVTSRSIFTIWICLTVLCHPEDKLYGVISVFKDQRVEVPLAACKNAIDPLHQKFSLRAHVAAGLVYNSVALYLIRRQKYDLSPQIIHDAPAYGLGRARHNRALTTLKFLPVVLAVNILIVSMQVVSSQTKPGQTILQIVLWTLVTPICMLFLQVSIIKLNPHARCYILRTFLEMFNMHKAMDSELLQCY